MEHVPVDKNENAGSEGRILLNPLTIQHVLERVFQSCNYQDLQSVRLVCKQWHVASFKTFATRSRLHFHDYPEMNSFLKETVSIEEKRVHQKPGDLTQTPSAAVVTGISTDLCTHVRISGLEFQSWTSQLNPFLTCFRLYLTTFEIDHGHVSHSPSGIEGFLRELAITKTRLTTLILYGSHLSYDLRDTIIPHTDNPYLSPVLPSVKVLKVVLSSYTLPKNGFRFFREMFLALPNLEDVTCINYSFTSLFTLERIEAPRSLSRLHLHLREGIGLHQFIECRYRITHLKLRVESSFSRNNLHALIQSFGNSLESLELHFGVVEGYNYSHCAGAFPSAEYLKALKYLKLVGFWGDLYFLKSLPRLEQVDVEYTQWKIAFPEGTQDEDLLPKRTRKLIRFFDEVGVYREVQ